MDVEKQKRLFGKTFRWVPEAPYGKADWDLIFKGFLDVGKSKIRPKSEPACLVIDDVRGGPQGRQIQG